MEYVKGESRQQTLLMPECIEDYVSAENPVRVLDAFVNKLDLAELGFVKTEIKDTGRPPYDPKDLLKLYVYGYINRIRSSRRLEKESWRNLEVIWLLQKLSPDHKTIANFRKDNAKALKGVFRSFVKLCVSLDLYGKELAAIDGSKFKAVNSTARNFSQERLEKRIAKIEESIDKYLKALEETDKAEDAASREKSAEEINGIVKKLNERKEVYQGNIKELEKTEEKQMSLTDSDSRLMLANGKYDVCYNVQAATDSKHRLIIDFEVGNQGNDMNRITPMTESVQEILETKRIAAVMDGGYDSTSDILAARKNGIDVHVAGTDFDVCIPVEECEQAEAGQYPAEPHKDGGHDSTSDMSAACETGVGAHVEGTNIDAHVPAQEYGQAEAGQDPAEPHKDGGHDSTVDIPDTRETGDGAHVEGMNIGLYSPAQERGQAEEKQVPIQSHKDGRCAYVAERNIVLCPMGNILYPDSYKTYKGKKGAAGFRNYAACAQCVCKCNVAKSRRFVFDVPMPEEQFSKEYNDLGLKVKQIRIKADRELVKKRKGMAEHPFGTIKRGMDGGYCLTKGLEKVRGEFALTFLAYNIKRVINILGCDKLLAAIAVM
jgi:transposase